MSWDTAINTVTPHVVRIETPTGYGTGFLAFFNADDACGIATAAHVVSHADEWQQPIRIRSYESDVPRFLKSDDRIIFLDHTTDSAVVLFLKGDLKLPEVPITLTPADKTCSVGASIGWLGFPTIEPDTLCFFSGTVSAHQSSRKSYLIDGVAINGVSGGPVFHCPTPEKVEIIGSVSAYHANRATGEALPGLLRAQDISHFDAVSRHLKSMDEARIAKQEFELEQKRRSEIKSPSSEPFEIDPSADRE